MGVQAYNVGFAPRLGFAYSISQHTVVRAGYGRSFTPAGLGAVFGQAPDYDPPVTIPSRSIRTIPIVLSFRSVGRTASSRLVPSSDRTAASLCLEISTSSTSLIRQAPSAFLWRIRGT